MSTSSDCCCCAVGQLLRIKRRKVIESNKPASKELAGFREKTNSVQRRHGGELCYEHQPRSIVSRRMLHCSFDVWRYVKHRQLLITVCARSSLRSARRAGLTVFEVPVTEWVKQLIYEIISQCMHCDINFATEHRFGLKLILYIIQFCIIKRHNCD